MLMRSMQCFPLCAQYKYMFLPSLFYTILLTLRGIKYLSKSKLSPVERSDNNLKADVPDSLSHASDPGQTAWSSMS